MRKNNLAKKENLSKWSYNKFIILLIGVLAITFIFLISSVSAQGSYVRASPAYTTGLQTSSFFGLQSYPQIDPSMCNNRQDFILQVDPLGCTPSVVTSNLLEQQNVAVFCPIVATQLNPLISVNAINSMVLAQQPGSSFSNNIAGVNYFPAQAALGQYNPSISSSYLGNIGYATIVLRQQPNESAMPDFVQGNLTAQINYNIQNAWGIGSASYFLPQLSDTDFNNNINAYSFWNGKGFIRLDSADNTGAVISIYSGVSGGASSNAAKTKVATLSLTPGQTSSDVYLPGFALCMGGLKVNLQDLENPDTTAKLIVDSNIIDLREGDTFLAGKCTVKTISKQGINQNVQISCSEDQQKSNFLLGINPKVNLTIGTTTKTYSVGDKLFDYTNPKDNQIYSVYLGFIGNNGKANLDSDIYIRTLLIPQKNGGTETNLTNDELAYVAGYDKAVKGSDLKQGISGQIVDAANAVFATISQIIRGGLTGKYVSYLQYSDSPNFLGTTVHIVGYAGVYDTDLSQLPKTTQDSYNSAMSDYQSIISNYAGETYPQGSSTTEGQQALQGAIDLANNFRQKRTVLQLCQQYSQSYGADSGIPPICNDNAILSSTSVSEQSVTINGETHVISFYGITQPSFDQFGVTVSVKNPDGTYLPPSDLQKGDVLYLTQETDYAYQPTTFGATAYFRYDNTARWQWSLDKAIWMPVSTTKVSSNGGKNANTVPSNDKIIAMINQLNGNGQGSITFDNGKQLLTDSGAKPQTNEQYIQLADLTADTATFNTYFGSGTFTSALPQQKLKLGAVDTFGSQYTFALQKINLQQVAKVSIEPDINYAHSNASFSFKIGIEKRNIQLTPNETQQRINDLNNTINKWQSLQTSLNTVVKVGKAACLVTEGALLVKNFIANLGGAGVARQAVMRSTGGWDDKCSAMVKAGQYTSVENCLQANSTAVDASVAAYDSKLQSQNQNIQSLSQGLPTTTVAGEKVPDNTKLFTAISPNVISSLSSSVKGVFPDGIPVGNQKVSIDTISSQINSNTTTLPQIEQVQLNIGLLNSNDPTVASIAKNQVQTILGQINSNYQATAQQTAANQASQNDITNAHAIVLAGTNAKEQIYYGSTATANNKFKITAGNPVALIVFNNLQYTLELSQVTGSANTYTIKNVYDDATGQMLDKTNAIYSEIIKSISDFKAYTADSYKNPYTNPQLQYYETGQYAGTPAIVPFDTTNGWYAAIQSNLPILGGLSSYDASGRVSSFFICNVGPNGREEGIAQGDDECTQFTPGTNQPPAIPGLSPSDAQALATKAVNAIQQASSLKQRTGTATINGNKIPIGQPATGTPLIQCEDFMSPSDCNILFNVCDPVVCPSSRCNLGGAYPVQDVIQSGIIGSLALCYPNFPQVKIPICISGVNAGLQGYISVLKSYQQCLQTSLNTGQQVGICDEVNSVYQCQFFWKQAIPLINYALPKIAGSVLGGSGSSSVGGGEYLAGTDAITNAQKSVDYFSQFYAANSYKAFQERSTESVGDAVCQNFISLTTPNGGNLFDTLIAPDSPSQFYGQFDETPYTTATNPPTSQYNVFYHIYAGTDFPAYYQVYLKGSASSFYQDTAVSRVVATGVVPVGQFATNTSVFTAPSGYQQLCIVVNGQEQCGFKQVTTDFGVNYLQQQYLSSQATQTNITSEANCVSGTPSVYNLLNPNVQSGVTNTINPAIYNQGIIRICSTNSPGQGTDANWNTANARWQKVGYCDTPSLGCWLDTNSVKSVITDTNIANSTLNTTSSQFVQQLQSQSGFFDDQGFASYWSSLNTLQTQKQSTQIINSVTQNLSKASVNNQKAELYKFRGNAYSDIATQGFNDYISKQPTTCIQCLQLGKEWCAASSGGQCITLGTCVTTDTTGAADGYSGITLDDATSRCSILLNALKQIPGKIINPGKALNGGSCTTNSDCQSNYCDTTNGICTTSVTIPLGPEPGITVPSSQISSVGINYPVLTFGSSGVLDTGLFGSSGLFSTGLLSSSIEYTFSDGYWFWCKSSCSDKSNWYRANLASAGSTNSGQGGLQTSNIPILSGNDLQWTSSLDGTNYLHGLTLLRIRTIQNNESFGSARLFTQSVSFSPSSLFVVQNLDSNLPGTPIFSFSTTLNKWQWTMDDGRTWTTVPSVGQISSQKFSSLVNALNGTGQDDGAVILFNTNVQSPLPVTQSNGITSSAVTCANYDGTSPLYVAYQGCISADQINQILHLSPAQGTGNLFVQYGKQYNIDPIIALAFFNQESNFGTAGVAAAGDTMSIGNIRYPSPYCSGTEYTNSNTGNFCKYSSWDQGIQSWYKLVSGSSYVGSGLDTVDKIVPKYCPATDNCDVNSYISNVKQFVKSNTQISS